MGINYSIDSEARIVRLTHVGSSAIEEYEATLTAIFRSPLYRPGFGFLVDRRGFEAPPSSFVQQLVSFLQRNRGSVAGARWAVVASTPAGYGMARVGQMLAEAAEHVVIVDAFRSVAEAEAWLRGRPP
jgi:hypothetical protein